MPIMIFMTSYYNNYPGRFPGSLKKISGKSTHILIIFLLLAAGFFSSCEEQPTTIGIELLPGYDFVEILSTDTIGIQSYTCYVDSVFSNNKTLSYMGAFYDPYFGNVTSDFVAHLRITREWPGGGEFHVDSTKLFLQISGSRGVFSTDLDITLYEITEQLSAEKAYYSNRDPHLGPYLGTYPLPLIKKDTVVDIVVSLPDTLGAYLMRDTTKLFQNDAATDFRSFFKGIYATVNERGKSPGKGEFSTSPLVMALSFSSANFNIRVYYHNNKASNLTYDFIINSNSVRYNRYFHDFSVAEPGKKITHINDGIQDTLSYMQGFYGVFTRLKLPGLSQFKTTENISVNKARLTIPVFLDNDIYTTTSMPSRIYLSYMTSDGVRTIVPDYYVNPGFFDGTFNSSSKTYNFNLAAFVQEYLEGRIPKPELEMYFPDGEYLNSILKTTTSTTPARFEFTFTRF